jgi:curli biogenesis system outer membrane secretion channel CsgG
MIVGSFGKLLDSYLLNIRVVDVETGGVIYADRATGRTVEELQNAIGGLAKRLAKALK